MNDIETGGPAFPRDHAQEGHNGMDLRDYFAAEAFKSASLLWPAGHPKGWEGIAMNAYAAADAMLKARAAK